MTEIELRKKVADWCSQYVGISEGSTAHFSILKTFNNSKLSNNRLTSKNYWSSALISSAFIANDLAGEPGSDSLFECVESTCIKMASLAERQGTIIECTGYAAKVGDIIIYDWKDSDSDNLALWSDFHAGIIVSVNENGFRVIEGDLKDTVGYRSLARNNSKCIRKFIIPKYCKFSNKTTDDLNVKLNNNCKFKGVTNTKVKVRSLPGTCNKKLCVLPKGKVVEVCDIICDDFGDNWYYIKNSDKYGYISADYITKQNTISVATATPRLTSLNSTCKFKGVAMTKVNMRSWAGVENKKLCTIPKGKTVEVYDEIIASTGKIWYYIYDSNKFGFVSAEYIARI